jgi:hypothetical protein
MYDSKGKQSKILLQSTKDIKPSFHVIIESVVSLSLSLYLDFLVFFSVFLLHSVDLSVSKTTRKCVIKKKQEQKNRKTQKQKGLSLVSPFLSISKNEKKKMHKTQDFIGF